jgi:hypothetical protein
MNGKHQMQTPRVIEIRRNGKLVDRPTERRAKLPATRKPPPSNPKAPSS